MVLKKSVSDNEESIKKAKLKIVRSNEGLGVSRVEFLKFRPNN